MTDFLLQAHSGWRWVVVVLIIIVAIKALVGWLGKQKWRKLDTQLLSFSQIAVRVQILLGIILFILLQKWDAGIAFFGGHAIPGLLAAAGVEFGAARAKKVEGTKKFMFAFIGFIIAIILVYGAIAVATRGS